MPIDSLCPDRHSFGWHSSVSSVPESALWFYGSSSWTPLQTEPSIHCFFHILSLPHPASSLVFSSLTSNIYPPTHTPSNPAKASTPDTDTPPPWGSSSLHPKIPPSSEHIAPSWHVSCCQLHFPDFYIVPWEHRCVLLISVTPQCLKGSRCSTKERRLMTCSYCPPLIISLGQQFRGSGMIQTLQGPKDPLLHTWPVGWLVGLQCLQACPFLWLQRSIPGPISPVLLKPGIPGAPETHALYPIKVGNHSFCWIYCVSQIHHFQPPGLKGIQRRDGGKQCMPSSIIRSDRLV